MRHLLTIGIVATLAAAGGCVPSEPVAGKDLDAAWYLHDNPWPRAEPEKVLLGDIQVPTSLTLRQEDNLIWSTVSIVKGMEKAMQGAGHLELRVHPRFANGLADVLARAQVGIDELADVLELESESDSAAWADAVVETLVKLEQVARLVMAEPGDEAAADESDPTAWSAGPMIQMVLSYVNEQTGGELLGGLGVGEIGQLRELLTQVVLRVAFAVAGKEQPGQLRERIVAALREGTSEKAMVTELRPMLLMAFNRSGEGASVSQFPGIMEAILEWTPRGLRVMESFVRQWDKMESLTFALRRSGDQRLVAITLEVKPGEEVRMAELFFMQPQMVFRGSTQIVVVPETVDTGETVILFEPYRGGATELRFEGFGWSLVRSLALPVSNAALRQLRIGGGGGPDGDMVNLVLLMEATGGKGDPRRLIAYHDVDRKAVLRSAFGVSPLQRERLQSFTYITPAKRYSYVRDKAGDGS